MFVREGIEILILSTSPEVSYIYTILTIRKTLHFRLQWRLRYDARRVTNDETELQRTHNENDSTLKCGETLFPNDYQLSLNKGSTMLSQLTN